MQSLVFTQNANSIKFPILLCCEMLLSALKWTVLPCHFTKCLSKYLSVHHYAAQFASVSKGLPTTLLWLQIYDDRHALWPRDLHNQDHRVLLSFVVCFTLLEIPHHIVFLASWEFSSNVLQLWVQQIFPHGDQWTWMSNIAAVLLHCELGWAI